MFIDEDPLGQVKFVHLFIVTVLNSHVIMKKAETKLIILAAIVPQLSKCLKFEAVWGGGGGLTDRMI